MLPSPPEPLLQLGATGLGLQAAQHLHVVMGARIRTEIQHTAKGSALGVVGAEADPSHPSLHQRTRAHRAGFQRHHQGAVVEAPVAAQACGLLQRHQFGVAKGLLIPFAPVAAPADRPPLAIEHHRCHRDLAGGADRRGAAAQALHPGLKRSGSVGRHRSGLGAAGGATAGSQQPATRCAADLAPSRWRMERL